MANSKSQWNENCPSKQLYFSGKVHQPLSRPQAIKNANNLVARFEVATPTTDPQAIIWSDASCGFGREIAIGGIGVVCDICLPGKPKHTTEEAEYISSEKGTFVAEAKGIPKGLQMIKKEIDAAELLPGTHLAIIIVTDCQSNVRNMNRDRPLKPKAPREHRAVLEGIKATSDMIVALGLNVNIEIYWCPRNTTPQMRRADCLAGRARRMRKRELEVNGGIYSIARARDCKQPKTKTEMVEGPNIAVEQTTEELVIKTKRTSQSRRRKTPVGDVVEEQMEDTLESESRHYKKHRVRIEEPQAASSTTEPQETVAVPEAAQDGQPDNAQVDHGRRQGRWYHCIVM